MAQATETPTAEFITKEDLLKRPLETGLAIDPEHPHEIDDAISVEIVNANKGIYRIKVHVADGGLLLGSDTLLAARRMGWSEYYADGTANTMLPAAVALHGLSLNTNHFETGTAPAVTIAFNFVTRDRSFHEVEIYSSRLACDAMSYKEFDREIEAKNPFAKLVANRGVLLNAEAGKTVSLPTRAERAAGIVSQYMVRANLVVARQMKKQHVPWIFRNFHMLGREHSDSQVLGVLYPDSTLFQQHNLAWYAPRASAHDGIAIQQRKLFYCHFTSPLRRFPDLVNHLMLRATLEDLPVPYTLEELDEISLELAQKIKFQLAARLGEAAIHLTESA